MRYDSSPSKSLRLIFISAIKTNTSAFVPAQINGGFLATAPASLGTKLVNRFGCRAVGLPARIASVLTPSIRRLFRGPHRARSKTSWSVRSIASADGCQKPVAKGHGPQVTTTCDRIFQ